jgi:hypothetical protein
MTVLVGGRGVDVLVGGGDAVWVGVGAGVQAVSRRVRKNIKHDFMKLL